MFNNSTNDKIVSGFSLTSSELFGGGGVSSTISGLHHNALSINSFSNTIAYLDNPHNHRNISL